MTSEHGSAATASGAATLAITCASASDVGRIRSVNQDRFGEFRDETRGLLLALVADGMGGHRAGEVASEMTVERVGDVFRRHSELAGDALLRTALQTANHDVFEAACEDPDLAGMGTTAVALLFDEGATAWVAHVGDSRAYRYRAGRLEPLTGDHSVVGELVRRGQLTPEQARTHPQSNEILRAIGTQPVVEVELNPVDVAPGDVFLLCSDGLTGMLPDEEIAEVLLDLPPDAAVRRLISLANEAGGTDNVTVQIVALPESRAPATRPAPRPASGTGPAAATPPAIPWLPIAAAIVLLLAILYLVFGPGRSG